MLPSEATVDVAWAIAASNRIAALEARVEVLELAALKGAGLAVEART